MDRYLFFCFVLGSFFSACARGNQLQVELSSDGPAVLDSNITFTAKLSFPSGTRSTGPFFCKFHDNLAQSFTTDKMDTVVFNFTTSYPSKKYNQGIYKMDVTVYSLLQEFSFFIRIYTQQGSAFTFFELTDALNMEVVTMQNNSSQYKEPSFVSTAEETHLLVQFHDPEHFLDLAQDKYFSWTVDDGKYIITTRLPVLKFNFTEIGQHTVKVHALGIFAEPTTTTIRTTETAITTRSSTTTPYATTSTTTPSNNTSLVRVKRQRKPSKYYQPFIGYKTGEYTLEITAKDPVMSVSIQGNNWLKNGAIMNKTISCTGSPPFYYCWAFDGFLNETNNATCGLPIRILNCKIQLLHYFSSPGQYVLPVVLFNEVSYQVIPLTINVYLVAGKTPPSLVVVPIASVCAAIITVAFGIGLYFYTRRNLRIEVADFDFEKEAPPEMQFFHRLKFAAVQYWFSLKRSEPTLLQSNSYQNISYD